MSTLKPVQPYAIALAAAALVVLVGCNDDRRSLPAGPSTDLAAAGVPDQRAVERFPEMVASLPSVRIAALPPEQSDAQLVEEVTRAGGRVLIGVEARFGQAHEGDERDPCD